MRKIFKIMFHRVVLVGLAILIQAIVLILMILKFSEYFVYFYTACIFLSIAVVLIIINNKSNPDYKIVWIIPILLFPIFGGLFYLMLGENKLSNRIKKKMNIIEIKTRYALVDSQKKLDEIGCCDNAAINQSHYISNYAYCPPYRNTFTEYLPLGEVKFERMVEELKKAKHFIFLEYFIIQEGTMWNTILKILVEKAKQGVDVRVIFDDMGCIMTLPFRYDKKLEAMGVKCCVFNTFIPVLSSKINNRDHRKIAVIDGYCGFTGGINLADEYINAYEKFGHWKDTAIMIKGQAVWSLTVMFLSMWDYLRGTDEVYAKYLPAYCKIKELPDSGYVQPFTDNPFDDEQISETIYINLINKAKSYVYINTPYLIIDNKMMGALTSAAKSGVDVRIVTPYIADKWYVHIVTRAYYEQLIESGVKIYEYTPGFMHAKSFVADDEYGVIGTVNLDYRSLYLHFECGVWLYKTNSIEQMKEDYMKTLKVCKEITLEECRSVSWYRKLLRGILRLFAPLM